MFFAALWRADEHLHQVIVQAVKDLPLESPFELRIIEIARMQVEVVGVERRLSKPWTNDEFDSFSLFSSVEHDQRMLVKP